MESSWLWHKSECWSKITFTETLIKTKMSRLSLDKVPKLALLYSPGEDASMVLGTANITFANEIRTEGTVIWKGKSLPCKV